jgi:hypothetical protein
MIGAATAVACAGLGIAASAAYAAPEPPSGGDCPNGYVAAQANKSFRGVAVPGGKTSSTPVRNEIIGLACFKRSSPTHGALQFRWSAVGPLEEGGFFYQLYDCTDRTVHDQHSKTLVYSNGTKSTHGQARAELALNPKHRYAVRVTGSGAYLRHPGLLAGGAGYFGRYPRLPNGGSGPPEFFDQSHCL